ncbi:toxin Cry1Ac domain D-VI-related protein [Listeria booriae]|uniref:toxin Cry1Ac domain D-VI-related protein n=1 Tax=Listeria booriae TaxID=1552123 RepID=UPI0016287138|nr:toxin Cry1Ac domain D-VI-related protein [Listeria booriae]MBC2068134.1 hypothetical protein [Listeria booriae]
MKKQDLLKKGTSIALVATIVGSQLLATVPYNVFAAENTVGIQAVPTNSVTVSTWPELQAALTSAAITDIYLNADITIGATTKVTMTTKNIHGNNHTLNANNYQIKLAIANATGLIEDLKIINTDIYGLFWSDFADVQVTYKNVDHSGGQMIYLPKGKLIIDGTVTSFSMTEEVFEGRELTIMDNATAYFNTASTARWNSPINMETASGVLSVGKNATLRTRSKAASMYGGANSTIINYGNIDMKSDSYQNIYLASGTMYLKPGSSLKTVAGDTVQESIVVVNGNIFAEAGATLEAESNGTEATVNAGDTMTLAQGSNFSITNYNPAGPALGSYSSPVKVTLQSGQGVSTWSRGTVTNPTPTGSYPGVFNAQFTLSGYLKNMTQSNLTSNNMQFVNSFKSGDTGKIVGGSFASDEQDVAKSAVDALFTDSTKTSIKSTTDQAAIDAAQNLVNKVQDPTVKANLQKDIDKAQSLLNSQNEQAKQATANTTVKELFKNNDPSSNAIKDTTNQKAIDDAQKTIDALAPGTVKTELQADLDKAQSLLDARNKQATDDQAQKAVASYAVNQLFVNNTPASDAIKASTDQAAIDSAQAEIDKIKDPALKVDLQKDLDRAQELLNQRNAAAATEKANQDAAKKAVDELFNNNTPSSNAIKPTTDQAAIDAAKALVNKVTDPTVKAALQADVDKAQSLLDARKAQEAADQAQKAVASYAVNQLFVNNTPASDAIKASTDQAAIDSAQAEIDKIKDPTLKTGLQKDLDRAQELLNQRNAASAAEKANQDAAKKAVNELFNNNTPSSNAIKPTTDQAAIDAAQKLVDKVTDPAMKAALQADVDKAQSLLDAKNAASAAEKANQDAAKKAVDELFNNNTPSSNAIKPTTDQAAIDAAQKLVDKVTDPTVKSLLQADVDKAQSLLDAKNAASAAEKANQDAAKKAVDELFNNNTPSSNAIKPTTDQAAIDAAQKLVDKVTDPTVKAALQANLDKAQNLLSVLAIPQLNPMTEADTVFSGKLDVSKYNPGTIRIYINNTPATVVAVDANGNFSYSIGNRKSGDVISVDYKDRTGQYNPATKTSITVTAASRNVTINKMTENDDTITGKAAPNAKVRYVVGGQPVNVGYADANGNYSMYIGKQKVGTAVGVEVFDPATNQYKAAVITTVLAVNVTIQPMTNATDTVLGTAPANAKLRFLINGVAVNVGTADASGNYSKFVGTQLVGTTVAVEMLNPETGKYELAKSTTVTGAPKSVSYTVNPLTTNNDTLTGTAPANAKLRFSIDGNLVSVITADASGNYSKFIGKQKANAVVSVELLNENTNQYTTPIAVTVTTGTGNATLTPVINTITEGQGVVNGTVPTSVTTVRVWVNDVAQTMVSATNGNFTWTKANLKAGDTVKVDYKDATGTWIATEKVVTK